MAIGDFFSNAWHNTVSVANAAGRGLSAVGQGVSDGAHWAQSKVDQGVAWVDHQADHAVDRFEHSSVGNNAVGHYLGQQVHDSVHFTGGLVKGVTGLGTSVVGLAGTVVKADGGAIQYATDGTYRRATNRAVSQAVQNFAHDPTAVVRNVGHAVSDAWHKDPNDFMGQAVGVIGTTILTAGAGGAAAAAGTAGRVAEGAEVVSTVARAGEAAEAVSTAGRAGEVATTAGRAGEVATTGGRAGEVATTAGRAGEVATTGGRAGEAGDAATTAARAGETTDAAAASGERAATAAPEAPAPAGPTENIPGALRGEKDLPREFGDMGHGVSKHGVKTPEQIADLRGTLKPKKQVSWFNDSATADRAVQEAPDALQGVRAANPAKNQAWENFVRSNKPGDSFGFRFQMDGVEGSGMRRAADGTLTESTGFKSNEVYIEYGLRSVKGGATEPYVKTIYPVMPPS